VCGYTVTSLCTAVISLYVWLYKSILLNVAVIFMTINVVFLNVNTFTHSRAIMELFILPSFVKTLNFKMRLLNVSMMLIQCELSNFACMQFVIGRYIVQLTIQIAVSCWFQQWLCLS